MRLLNVLLPDVINRMQLFNLWIAVVLRSLSTSLEKFTLGLRRIFMPHTLSAEGWTPDKVMDLGRELKER